MRKLLLIPFIVFALFSCKKEEPEPEPETPENVTLVFPFINSLCNQGTGITAEESTIMFEWEASGFTDSYELHIENLDDHSTSSHSTSETRIAVTLSRATPYAWYVVSLADGVPETGRSETWKFYLAGESESHYAPFPADIISPSMASTVSAPVNLVWSGSDPDDDISAYDIYFGTEAQPPLFAGNTSDTVVNNITVTANTIYYWRIITRDSRDNTSDTGVFQFKVE